MSTPKFHHLVVVMMENRSFDHMLGLLYTAGDPPPRGQSFNGVDAKGLSNPSPAGDGPVPVAAATSFSGVTCDPGHDFIDVQWQLFWTLGETVSNTLPIIPTPAEARMQGFVADYESSCPAGAPAEIMSVFPTFGASHSIGLTVLPALARAFAVSDVWFAAAPTQTLPNRSFCNAATSNGFVENSDDWTQNGNPTIFSALEGHTGLLWPWRIYHEHDSDAERGFSLTVYIHWPELARYDENPDFLRTIEQFEADAAAGNLPAYSFIEPNITAYYQGNSELNDQHPVQDVRRGEDFINRIYTAIVSSESVRDRTLFVIVYDEHGGIFDHVPPPVGVPAPHQTSPMFDFTRLGVRVPAMIVSSFIEAGTVYNEPGWIDHTAIIKTLTTRWKLAPLSPRDAAAPDLGELLTLGSPRTDLPRPRSWNLPLVRAAANEIPANRLQRDFVQLVARAHGLPPPAPPSTVAGVMSFLQSVRKSQRDAAPPRPT